MQFTHLAGAAALPGALFLWAFAALPACAQEVDPEAAAGAHGARAPLPGGEALAALPPDGGPEFNRLVFEQSPYLRQHARNPVDWYPWGEEAFARARQLELPIFLSVGYSTCHWCHVMEHESFEDEAVAALLNRDFVCVKVDREERPDVDQAFMAVTQALTGRGGWPNTVVLTPGRRPFFAGTYFPKESAFGRPGMLELVPHLAEVWKERRAEVEDSAEQIVEHVIGMGSNVPGSAPGVATLRAAQDQLSALFDPQWGGFGQAPKFPSPHQLRFLLRQHLRTGEARCLEMVERTLERMRAGGMWDHVGFGFHRYSTDQRWFLPHFEKMLYDQASLGMAFVEAYQATGRADFEATAREIYAYVLRDMTHPDGGFYSAEDADSEGEEGLFYLWTPAEAAEVLGAEEAELWCEAFGVSEEGNYVEEASGQGNGRSIPFLPRPLELLAQERGLEPATLRARLEESRELLFEAREQRVHPLKDDKVLSDWNGLMIASLALAARALDEPAFATAAARAGDFVFANLREESGRLLKRWRSGEAAFPAMLEDHAFLAWGCLELFESTQEARWLERAVELTEEVMARFHDGEGGGFFLAPEDGEELFTRAKQMYDGARPSGNSVMVSNLLRLSRITARPEWERLAEKTLAAFAGNIQSGPASFTHALIGLDFGIGPTFEVVIAGLPEGADTQALLRAVHAPFLPSKVVVLRPDDEAEPPITRLAPYTLGQRALEGRAAAYVCRDHACEAPTTSVEKALSSLREGAGPEPAEGSVEQ